MMQHSRKRHLNTVDGPLTPSEGMKAYRANAVSIIQCGFEVGPTGELKNSIVPTKIVRGRPCAEKISFRSASRLSQIWPFICQRLVMSKGLGRPFRHPSSSCYWMLLASRNQIYARWGISVPIQPVDRVLKSSPKARQGIRRDSVIECAVALKRK